MYLPVEDLSDRYSVALQALNEIAEAYYFQGELARAFQLWQTSERLLEMPEIRPEDQLKFLLRYGDFLAQYYFLTNREEELMYAIVQRTQRAAEDLQEESGIARALFLSGQAHYYHCLLSGNNDYASVCDDLSKSAALHEKLGNSYELSLTLFYLGLTYDRQEQRAQAKALYLRALEIAEQQGNKWAASEATRHLTDHSDGEQRLEYARRSLELRIEMKNRRALPAAQLLLSEIYLERGGQDLALKYCQQAAELATEMELHSYLAQAALIHGEIAHQQGNLAEAREQFARGVELAGKLNNNFIITAANEKLQSLEVVG